MTSKIPGTGVFSLGSALGLTFSGDSRPEPQDFAANKSCFAVSGSYADTQNLSQHWRAQAAAASGSHEAIFVHSDLSAQQVTEAVNMVATNPPERHLERLGRDDACSHIYAAEDPHQGSFSISSKDRYNGTFLSPHYPPYDTPLMTPCSVDTGFTGLSNNSSSFSMNIDAFSSSQPTLPSAYDLQCWDPASEQELPLLESPFAPMDYSMHLTLDVEMSPPSEFISRQ
ncbi:hypothetical protein EI94DRAFT_1815493 [Lactarius quietus]|nr:hypothetical protein EI94DRAFT_1815493 [Lactarius quietus]